MEEPTSITLPKRYIYKAPQSITIFAQSSTKTASFLGFSTEDGCSLYAEIVSGLRYAERSVIYKKTKFKEYKNYLTTLRHLIEKAFNINYAISRIAVLMCLAQILKLYTSGCREMTIDNILIGIRNNKELKVKFRSAYLHECRVCLEYIVKQDTGDLVTCMEKYMTKCVADRISVAVSDDTYRITGVILSDETQP